MATFVSKMSISFTSAMNSVAEISFRAAVYGHLFSTASTASQYLLRSFRWTLRFCSTWDSSCQCSNCNIWSGFGKTGRRKVGIYPPSSSVCNATIAGTVLAAIITFLITYGAVIFVRKRKSNRNAHVVKPAGTGAPAPGWSSYPPPPGVTLMPSSQPSLESLFFAKVQLALRAIVSSRDWTATTWIQSNTSSEQEATNETK